MVVGVAVGNATHGWDVSEENGVFQNGETESYFTALSTSFQQFVKMFASDRTGNPDFEYIFNLLI
jgi:hypothetical protein